MRGRPVALGREARPSPALSARQRASSVFFALLASLASTACKVEGRVGLDVLQVEFPEQSPSTAGALTCGPDVDLGAVPPRARARAVVTCVLDGTDSGRLSSIEPVILGGGLDQRFHFAASLDGRPLRPPAVWAAGRALRLDVSFEGEVPGPARAAVRVSLEDGRSAEVTARAFVDPNRACALVAEPDLVDFGAVTLGTVAEARLGLRNASSGTCAISAVELFDSAHPSFSERNEAPLSLRPGQSSSLSVQLSPVTPGVRHGLLGVYGERGVLLRSVPLRGAGRRPEMLPSVRPARLDFGRRRVGCSDAASRELEILAGEAPLDVTLDLEGSAGFGLPEPDGGPRPSADGHRVSLHLPPGERARLSVEFTPEVEGEHFGRVRVDLGEAEPIFVGLLGIGAQDSLTEQIFTGPPPYRLAATPVHGSLDVWLNQRPLPQFWNGRVVWGVDYLRRELLLEGPLTDQEAEIAVRFEPTCVPPTCGDGVVHAGEACDDGNDDETDACLTGCQAPHCGDGHLRANSAEECDDGNTISGDGCNAVCALERCGNGVVEGREECDTGGLRSDDLPDACRMDCRFPTCGDGVADTGESCDDGNEIESDACVSCQLAICGDGFVRATGPTPEACDDGNRVSSDGCENDCTRTYLNHHILVDSEALAPVPGGPPLVIDQPIQLPFWFNFLGHRTRMLDVSQPGLIIFDGSAPTDQNVLPPSTQGPTGYLAWWWDELRVTGPAYIWWWGFQGHRTVVLRFDELTPGGSPEARLAAEIRISESFGSIWVHYGEPRGMGSLASATVGWASPEGDRGQDVLGCSPSCDLSQWPMNQIHIYQPGPGGPHP